MPTLQEIVPENVGLKGFADDHSLKRSFKADDRKAEQTTISTLPKCLIIPMCGDTKQALNILCLITEVKQS